jgi:hypothetical protein
MQSIKIACVLVALLWQGMVAFAQKPATGGGKPNTNYKVVMTSEAFYPEGEAKLYEILNRKIIFTDSVRALVDQGIRIDSTVLLSFFVETDSTISEMSILQDVGHGIGQRLADFVQNLRYAPGRENTIPVRTNVVLSMPIIIK